MQTFLPYPSFRKSLECLDNKRLGKQRVEARQIYNCLRGESSLRWRNHPAVKMWKGYENALGLYHNIAIDTWLSRGFQNNMAYIDCDLGFGRANGTFSYPRWLGLAAFHDSHKSNLIRKLPEHYAILFPGIPDNLEYVWPC